MSEGTAAATRTSRGWALALGSLAVFLGSVSAAIVTIALKPMLAELGGSSQQLIWASLAYLVPYASVLLAVGKLADAIGHRPVLLSSLTIYGIGSALGAITASVPEVVLYRAVQGVGGGALLISLAWVTKAWEGPRQGLAVGIWRAFLLAGTVGGPALGGALTAMLGWRSVMWLTAPLALIGLALAWWYLDEPATPRGLHGFDWTGATATVVGLSALVVVFSMLGEPGGSPAQIPTAVPAILFGLIAVSGLALWPAIKRSPQPIVAPGLFGIPRFAFANAGTLLVCVAMFAAMFFVPLFLQYHQGYTPMTAAAATLPITILALFVGTWGGALTDRVGPVAPSAVGFVLLAGSFAMLAQIGAATPYWYIGTAMSLTGIGMALPIGPTAFAAITSVPTGSEGEASGIFNLAHNLGRPLGLATLGIVLAVGSVASFQLVFWLSGAYSLIGIVTALGLGTPPRGGA